MAGPAARWKPWWWQTATALGRPLEELLDLWAQTDWARVDRRLQGRERGSPFTTAGFARMVVTISKFSGHGRVEILMESANKVPFCSSGYDALDIGWVVPVGRGGRAGAK